MTATAIRGRGVAGDPYWKNANERKRHWDRTHRGQCELCGARTNRYDYTRCPEHSVQRLHAGARRLEIQRLWKEGKSLREIAAELDSTVGSIGVTMVRMRHAGWDLPYRNRGYA